jgi:hypothetical protein
LRMVFRPSQWLTKNPPIQNLAYGLETFAMVDAKILPSKTLRMVADLRNG